MESHRWDASGGSLDERCKDCGLPFSYAAESMNWKGLPCRKAGYSREQMAKFDADWLKAYPTG